ncbi:unnamed protein product [Rotaria magnacalcarata]|uniref:Uncharacterized protein n=1 Tax=Rotaria magnacalcarata TaxID=392030 RepID=A0A819N6Z8_9BILA|nr:unnamed protein product [Rotaria magnacalcarata]
MSMIQANRIGIKECVCGAIECNMTPQMNRLSNYNNWRYLSADEIRQLIALCYVFSPDVFEDKVFFNSPALCGNSSNKFYEISQVRNQLLAVSSIVIAGQSRRVNKIMITLNMASKHHSQSSRHHPLKRFRLDNENQGFLTSLNERVNKIFCRQSSEGYSQLLLMK